ncbi:MAG: hypothetical protein ACP5N7_00160 [Candidatus Pacearchaeota archaeon]
MVKKFIENGYAEVVKILGIFLTAGSMIVAITLFIADRPTRAEVKQTIDDRLNPMEQQLKDLNNRTQDIYNILIDMNKKP